MVQKIIAAAFALLMVGAIVVGVVALAQGPEEQHSELARGQERQTTEVAQARGGQGNGGQGLGQGQGQGLNDTGSSQGQGQGQGQNGTGSSQGQSQGQGQNGTGSSEPLADVQPGDWRTIEGTVVALNDLVVDLEDGTTVQVGLGPEHYREAQGFILEIGQRVAISGFDEDGEFKAGTVEILDSGATIALRSTDGRPMWAGQGQGSSRS